MAALLESVGLPAPHLALRIALPIGISFFTFESMSYVIDVYRRDIEPHPDYFEYLTFVAFFPHLVAGPIVRASDLLPQFDQTPRLSREMATHGLLLIVWGLFKKTVIALVRLFLLVVGRKTARLDHVVDLLVQRQALGLGIELLDQRHEGQQRGGGLGAELVVALERRLPHGFRVRS